MKKLLLSIALFCAILTANAQEVKFGLKAGLNLSSLAGDDLEAPAKSSGIEVDQQLTPNFFAGGFAHIGLSDKFAVQPELLFSMQGAKFDVKDPISGDDFETNFQLSYLNVPVLAKFYPIENLSIQAGPQIGFLLSAKDKSSGSSTEDIKDSTESIDFSGAFGVGYEFNQFNVGARYTIGFTEVFKIEGESLDNKNGVLQIYAGYSF